MNVQYSRILSALWNGSEARTASLPVQSIFEFRPDLLKGFDAGTGNFPDDARSRPLCGIDKDFSDVFVVKDREGFVTRSKIEDSAVAAFERDAAAEDFADVDFA